MNEGWDADDGAITQMLDMIVMDSLYTVICIRCGSKNVDRRENGEARVDYFCQACGKTFKVEGLEI